ncbi:MAG: hypothetical protein A2X46_04255 [Lentisphaerae bacterium GWF2_57_35]|nr:MAG: hypothetical protein A2X46_04255 [Lentisphaerae bacterium GWF2_57_35]
MITTACSAMETVGQIRVQPLGSFLVRLELKAPNGFEDRETFTVQSREFPPCPHDATQLKHSTVVATAQYQIIIPNHARSLVGVVIEPSGSSLSKTIQAEDLLRTPMPSPSSLPEVWIMADAPRVAPPAWGALPPPQGHDHPHSGWDITNNAPDLYVFFPKASGYAKFREDFLQLTGRVPLLPLYAFGLWYSRYHPYSEDTALETIEKFRSKNIPLDVFVADTDWRVGASCGYGVNTNLFPDMRRFIQRAHDQNVYLMYNDHPEPIGKHALAPEELEFRYTGLSSLLEQGADVWWFDRNWHTHLQAPVEGLNKEVWGMRLYHDVTRANRPERRPLIMSNVDGINNGQLEYPSHPAAHRYPIWWTGDTIAEWKYLQWGVQNGVDAGIHSLLPYVHEDLGGHHDQPEAEYYTRFMQFGAFSPIARIHCTAGKNRYPWHYDATTEKIVGDFFRLRYRLLPMIYAAAYEAHRSGTPLMRRCDLEWPNRPEARDNTQYLFGDDLLIAPIIAAGATPGGAQRTVWIPDGEWSDLWTGETIEGPAAVNVEKPLNQYPLFVRRGGIIASTPQSYHTKNTSWNHIVLDAYIPSKDATNTRQLYEDDGLTTAYANHLCGITEMTLQKQKNAITLTIDPSKEFNRFPVEKRSWTLRLHLPKGQDIAEATWNWEPLPSDRYCVYEASTECPDMVFTGEHSLPPPQSGAVVELTIHDQPATNRMKWSLILSPK